MNSTLLSHDVEVILWHLLQFAAMATNQDVVSLLLRYIGVEVQTIIPFHHFFLVFPGFEIKLLPSGVIRFLVRDS